MLLIHMYEYRLFALLARLTGAKSVLELGTFTGYSALCFAEGIAMGSGKGHNSDHIGDNMTNSVITCDIDAEAQKLAHEYIQQSPYKNMMTIHNTDCNSILQQYSSKNQQFDIIFIDSDKKQYITYINTILTNHLLSPRGLIILDNTLWKGLVLHTQVDLQQYGEEFSIYGKSDRQQKLTNIIHDLNVYINSKSNVLRPLLLPMRDGLTIIEYIPQQQEEEEEENEGGQNYDP